MSKTEIIGERDWWPADYADEVMPTARTSPEQWLLKLPNDGFTIASPYHGDDLEHENEAEWKYTPLANGERVDFIYYEYLGTVDITVNPDGTYEAHGLIHADASCFWDDGQCGDGNPCGDTMDEMARAYAEDENLTAPKRITVGCGHWSNSIPFSVVIEGNKASLQEAGTA